MRGAINKLFITNALTLNLHGEKLSLSSVYTFLGFMSRAAKNICESYRSNEKCDVAWRLRRKNCYRFTQ